MTKHIKLSSHNVLKGFVNFARDTTKCKLSSIQKQVLLASSEHYESFSELKLAVSEAEAANRDITIELDKLKHLFEGSFIDPNALSTFLNNIEKFDWANYLEALNYLRSDKNNDAVFDLTVKATASLDSDFMNISFNIYTENYYPLQGKTSDKDIKKAKLSRYASWQPNSVITLAALDAENYSERLIEILSNQDVKKLVDSLSVSKSLDEGLNTADFAPAFAYPAQYSLMVYNKDAFPEEWQNLDGSVKSVNELLDNAFYKGFLFSSSAADIMDYLRSNNK